MNQLGLISLCLMGVIIAPMVSKAQDSPNQERLYLRYQGALDGVSGELPDTISCEMRLLDRGGDPVWEEEHEGVPVFERHFSIGLGVTEALYSTLFTDPLSLQVDCDLDGDGEPEVSITEPVGATPRAAVALSAQGLINGTSLQVNGVEVVNADGEWVGAPPVTNRVQIGEQELVSPEGTWLGAVSGLIIPSDRDGDQVPDLFEQLLGTDPDDVSDAPLDADGNGLYDILEPPPEVPPSAADLSFSNAFTAQRSADIFNVDPETIAEWVAAEVNFSERGGLTSLTVNITVTHTVDTQTLEVILVAPDGARFSLLAPRVVEGETRPEESFTFNGDTPPETLDWSQVIQGEVGPRELYGTWSLILRDQFGEGLGAIAAVTNFSMEAGFNSTRRTTLTRDLDLEGAGRIIGVQDPLEDDHVANKSYVDAQASDVRDQVSTLRGDVTVQVNDLRGELEFDLEEEVTARQAADLEINTRIDEAQRDPDLSYPTSFTYRARLFETYDVESGSYLFGDLGELFGGVTPSEWSSGATADQVNLNQLGAILINESKSGSNALLSMQTFESRADEEGFVYLIHFQVENTTDLEITWPIEFLYSCHEGRVTGPQRSSLALNQVSVWSSEGTTCDALTQTAQVSLALPPQTVSEVVMAISASAPQAVVDGNAPNNRQRRRVMLAFTGECLTLPEGLRFRRTWE